MKNVKIIDYKSTNTFLRQIDNYSIANNSSDSLIRVKVLFKMKNTDADVLFQGYLIQYNKLKPVNYPSKNPCDTLLNQNDYYKDCKALLKEKTDQQFKDIYEKRINEQITEMLLTADCMKGLSERYTASYYSGEYQYTLYYYDQAGNVIITLPPEGVSQLSQSYFKDGKLYNPQNRKIVPPHNFNFASYYTYNSFNQVINQKSSEQTTHSYFLYDYARRLRLSQNATQKVRNQYAYTIYDYLDRVVEVGLINNITMSTQELQDSIDANQNFPNSQSWNNSKSHVVTTRYSTPDPSSGRQQDNLKGRIAQTIRYGESNNVRLDNITEYSYDAHGNVKTLYQLNPELGLKTIEYYYDLISGNVKKLSYQRGKKDQFYHMYDYDADNRIKKAYTSLDSILWDEEARYFYYRHGPLARVEIGPEKVQGMDYYYTLQGWIKGTNTINVQNSGTEPGLDANNITGNINKYVSRDASSYNLGYNTNDYAPIGSGINQGFSTPNLTWPAFTTILPASGSPRGLYNGNIVYLLSQYNGQAGFADSIAGQTFRYDQLHRIRSGYSYRMNGSNWAVYNPGYTNNYEYDKNGNITKLLRFSEGNWMDSLNYKYSDPARPNLLKYITDTVGATRFNEDVDNQNASNYVYDQIGNLTTDSQSASTISWDVYQKIRKVERAITLGGGGLYIQTERFFYDATGNRIQKKNNSNNDSISNYYVRDASGNILSIYNRTYKEAENQNLFNQSELNIFGSSRIGSYFVPSRSMYSDNISDKISTRYRNYRRYETSNHLGNVMAVVSDRAKGLAGQVAQKVSVYEPDIVSAQDYYPFGQQLRNRTYPIVNNKNGFFTKYRYGFNDKEADVDGEIQSLNTYDYGFRIYNPGIARFLSVDPLTKSYPWYTPFQFAGNTPIQAIDLDGLEEHKVNENLSVFGPYKDKTAVNKAIDNGTASYGSNTLPVIEIKAERSFKYEPGFVGNVNRVINNLFDSKPSDEAKLREPDGFKYGLKLTLNANLTMLNIASTFSGIGLSANALKGATLGVKLYNATDIGFTSVGLYNKANNIENEFVDGGNALFGFTGLLESRKVFNKYKKGTISLDEFRFQIISNESDIEDIIHSTPINNLIGDDK